MRIERLLTFFFLLLLMGGCGSRTPHQQKGYPGVKEISWATQEVFPGDSVVLHIQFRDSTHLPKTTYVLYVGNRALDTTNLPLFKIPDDAFPGETLWVQIRFQWDTVVRETLSPDLILANHPPSVVDLRMTPETLTSDVDTVTFDVWGADPDGDPLEFRLVLRLNGTRVGERRDYVRTYRFVLPPHRRGDTLQVDVTPYDDFQEGLTNTYLFPVWNGRPVLQSPRIVREDSLSVYVLPGIVDPDGDSLTYQLLEAPEGTRWRGDTLVLPRPDTTGRVAVSLRAEDGQGSFAEFRLTFAVRPLQPEGQTPPQE